MSGKIAVMGDIASVGCFKVLGLDVYESNSEKDVRRTITRLAKENYSVVFITEQAASLAQDAIDSYKSLPFPAIILIPSNQGSLGIGMANIRKNVEKAVGTDIFFDD